MNKRIYLSPPHMSNAEKELLCEAFDSNWIAPLGPNLDAFEKEVSKYLNIKYSSALSSGTAALHLALRILGISKGDKVICPTFTFAASANVIMYENAIPIFIDSDIKTWTIDVNLLEIAFKKYRPKAIISVDIYGQSCDYETIHELCEKYNVLLIEDSAEAFGSKYKNKFLGTMGDIGIYSFNGNKIMTTSGGGMLVSKNKKYVEKSKFLSSQARENKIHYEHKELGYNYRMSNLLAAIGRGQLKRFDSMMKKRREIFDRYYNELSDIDGIEFLEESKYCLSNRWLTILTINKAKLDVDKDIIIKSLEKDNIESRPLWKPMHLQPFFKNHIYIKGKNTDISARLFKNGICLPSGSSLSKEDQFKIIKIIKNIIKK